MPGRKLTICWLVLAINVYAEDTAVPVLTKPAPSASALNYYYNGESLRLALELFSKVNGLQLSLTLGLGANTLAKAVNGRFAVSDNSQLLNSLARQYGFDWFIYSGTLYITPTKRVSRSVSISPDDMPLVRANLQQLGLLNPKFGYAELPSENKLTISGPETYVNMLIAQIKQLNVAPTAQQFAIYRLNYANAADVQLSFNNQQITIPGVATILQSLLQGGPTAGVAASKLAAQVTEPIRNQANQELAKLAANNATSAGSSGGSSDGAATGVVSTAMIQADSRANSIVIRDKSSNLQIYKNLIELLDVPTPLIQVEVLIIHLDQQGLNQAGVNWWASQGGAGGGFGAGNLMQPGGGPSNNLSFYYGQVAPGQLVVTNFASFMSSLNFLEQHNLAKAVGKPSLATSDNIPAIVNVNENLYFGNNGSATQNNNSNTSNNLAGYVSAQIVQALQITPHVIFKPNNQRDIKLAIVLQDGAVSDQNTGILPNTTQSSITSQAVIKEGQSILLAGYSRDETQEQETKVPILGDIPLLGWFFKSSSNAKHNITTLYLVTPHIIWQDDMYKLKSYTIVNGNKFDISNNYTIVPESTPKSSVKSAPATAKHTVSQVPIVTPAAPVAATKPSPPASTATQLIYAKPASTQMSQIATAESTIAVANLKTPLVAATSLQYFVRVGSFKQAANAYQVCGKLASYGQTKLYQIKSGYTVCRLGPYSSLNEAKQIQQQLSQNFVVSPLVVPLADESRNPGK